MSTPDPGPARSVAALAALTLIVVVVVGGTWRYTRHVIADNVSRGVQAEIAAVLPTGLYDNVPAKDQVLVDTGGGQPVPVYRARRNGMPAAAALTFVTPAGYAGPIELLVGISADGRVLGVRVQAHTETPRIGEPVAAEDSPLLAALAADDRGDFDAVAGATVTSRAIIDGVHAALQFFTRHRDEIFNLPAGSGDPQ